eukprot:TRINITY_DN70025_c0_g1_i1.p1 TRINITY_DN70025_c0_g1~~TRINITY_DN70025_c0_g1_i1.p1  ORF type:complete len:238 (+),score=19.95 TRINITY_DN70025_c0_g1_i1:43-714(+)
MALAPPGASRGVGSGLGACPSGLFWQQSSQQQLGEPGMGDGINVPSEIAESYCAEVNRLLAGVSDESSFLGYMSVLDRRYLESLFVRRFGSMDADPMQALRQPTSGGVVRRATPANDFADCGYAGGLSQGTDWSHMGSHAAELHRRHLAFLGERSSPSVAGCGSVAEHPPPWQPQVRPCSHTGNFGHPAGSSYSFSHFAGFAGEGADVGDGGPCGPTGPSAFP